MSETQAPYNPGTPALPQFSKHQRVVRLADGRCGTVTVNHRKYDQFAGIRTRVRWDGNKGSTYIMNRKIRLHFNDADPLAVECAAVARKYFRKSLVEDTAEFRASDPLALLISRMLQARGVVANVEGGQP